MAKIFVSSNFGNLLVCSKVHGNCCCSWTEKARLPVNLDLYQQERERQRIRNKVHLTFTACLGPCAVGNSALLQIFERSIWFKDLNDDLLIPLIFDYIESMLRADQVIPPTASLATHIYERYISPPDPTTQRLAQARKTLMPNWSASTQSV